ncbi:etfB [Symbiodinium microadriaticum]|nr:etfB [Symbiodinium sp. KB8]CAE7259328.1 etfB [Symbiodinium microadriaticum]
MLAAANVNVLDAASMGVDMAPRLKVVKVEEPPARAGGVKVSSVEELIDKLKNEAKVL